MVKDFIVTPWEVKGRIDYDRLIKEFGTQKLDDGILKKLEKIAGELHPLLRRRIFFSHRDLDWLLREYEKGNKFYLYTGRGPSGETHLGHLIPWILTKWFQEKFDADLWFQMTDDEKFYFKPELTTEYTNKMAYENALDVIALGFDEKKHLFFRILIMQKHCTGRQRRSQKSLLFQLQKRFLVFLNLQMWPKYSSLACNLYPLFFHQ